MVLYRIVWVGANYEYLYLYLNINTKFRSPDIQA